MSSAHIFLAFSAATTRSHALLRACSHAKTLLGRQPKIESATNNKVHTITGTRPFLLLCQYQETASQPRKQGAVWRARVGMAHHGSLGVEDAEAVVFIPSAALWNLLFEQLPKLLPVLKRTPVQVGVWIQVVLGSQLCQWQYRRIHHSVHVLYASLGQACTTLVRLHH